MCGQARAREQHGGGKEARVGWAEVQGGSGRKHRQGLSMRTLCEGVLGSWEGAPGEHGVCFWGQKVGVRLQAFLTSYRYVIL